MFAIRSCELPPDALLGRYRESGAFADCYVTELAGGVSHAEFVEAFFTTRLFKVERLVLRVLASRPSTDVQARRLARGESDTFAAWSVEGRAANQLLLADFTGRTRSWLTTAAGERGTRLYFGSAVVPSTHPSSRRLQLGGTFRALLGFHRLYSQALLFCAQRRLSPLFLQKIRAGSGGQP